MYMLNVCVSGFVLGIRLVRATETHQRKDTTGFTGKSTMHTMQCRIYTQKVKAPAAAGEVTWRRKAHRSIVTRQLMNFCLARLLCDTG